MTDNAGDSGRPGVVAAAQAGASPLAVLAAPATGDEFNTIGERLVPKACFKVEDLLFDFDSSFVRPEIGAHLPQLAQLRNDNKVQDLFPPLSVFGHADPVGNDDNNKKLSGRRATAIYAMLVRDVDLWEKLFTNPLGNDKWGTRAVQTMLSTVQDAIAIDGEVGDETRGAIRKFQTAQGLSVDGAAGPNTRKALYRAYMDALCGPDLVLDKTSDFLGRNQDAGGKGDFQGCSEFNPLLLFSQDESAGFEAASDKTERNQENAPNRRVMILLFAAGRRVNPSVWPCPRASEGVADCKKRFFPDADVRRSFQGSRRAFEDTKDTFACRFYQIISDDSPCERVKPAPPPPPVLDGVLPLIFFPAPDEASVPAATAAAASQSALVGSTGADAVGAAAGAPVGAPAVAPATRVVAVRKPQAQAARVDVDLKTDKPFDGNGTFDVSPKGKIDFFLGSNKITFNGKDNVFGGAELEVGVTLFAEGAQASNSMDDVTLILTLSGGSKKAGPPAKATMTSVEVTLDILEPIVDVTKVPPALPQPTGPTPTAGAKDKVFGGRGLPEQNEGKTSERAIMLVRQVKPSTFTGNLVLTAIGDKVQAFVDGTPSKGEKALPKRQVFPASDVKAADRRFFAEGISVSTKVHDTGFQLGIEGIQEDADRVAITVVHAEIVSNVEPKDVRTIALVPEKPERKTKSKFFPAPIIIGVNYDVQLRPFTQIAQPDGPFKPLKFSWSSRVPAAQLALADTTKEVVKLKAKKVSTTQDDTAIDLLVDSDIGKFVVSHRLTRVDVEIHPVISGSALAPNGETITSTDDINFVRNPCSTVILRGADAADPKKTPKIEITKMEPKSLNWTDDDPRIAWWIIGGEAAEKGKAKYEGRADFLNDEKAKRGTKIQIVGQIKEGDILVQPYSGGFGYGMFRTNVVELRQIKYRVNRIFTDRVPAVPAQAGKRGRPEIPARVPTQQVADAKRHIKVANIYLRQVGMELIPDTSTDVASSAGNAAIGQPNLDRHVVAVTAQGDAVFDVKVDDQTMTFRTVVLSDALRAIRVNARNAVVVFAYIHSIVIPDDPKNNGALAVTVANPVNHSPERKIPPKPSLLSKDKGVPSSSLIKKTGIAADVPVSEVRMVLLDQLSVRFQANDATARDVNLQWGIVVPTSSIDTNATRSSAPSDLAYGSTLAHELGHVLGLAHRGLLSDPITDRLAVPRLDNVMSGNTNFLRNETFDIVQTKAIRFSEVLFHNP